MKLRHVSACLLTVALALPASQAIAKARHPAPPKGPALAANEQLIDHGRFKQVHLYSPSGSPRSFVLLLSGDGGWEPTVARQAQTLVQEGALVAGIDTVQLMQALEADGGDCVFPDGDLENLAHFLQAYAKMPGYHAPVLVGYSSGAALGYGVLAQAPTGTFAAGLMTGFCTDLDLRKPLCAGDGLQFKTRSNRKGKTVGVDLLPRQTLGVPLVALLGDQDNVCEPARSQALIDLIPAARQTLLPGIDHDYSELPSGRAALAAAFRSLTARQEPVVPPAPADLGDLPVIEQPVPGNDPRFAVFWSGDGGWAGLDKDVAAALNAKGISVVGVDSLRYFWSARTPEGIAADVEKIARHYLAAWKKQKVMLLGYSQGADVLPFAVTRLSPALRQQVLLAAGMGLSDHAVFEFQLTNWVKDNNNGPETLPEIARIKDVPFLCIYGAQEDDTICPKLAGTNARIVQLPGGHHFNGAYSTLADTILSVLPATTAH